MTKIDLSRQATGLAPDAQKLEIDKAATLVGTRAKLNFIQGSNTTLTVADNAGTGAVDVTIAATAAVDHTHTVEDKDTWDGVTTTWALAHTPKNATSITVYFNGQRIRQGAGKDYTLATNTITFLFTPASTDLTSAEYSY